MRIAGAILHTGQTHERGTEILDHDGEFTFQRVAPADNDIVAGLWRRDDASQSYHFAKPAANAVAFRRVADFFGDSKADADRAGIVAKARLHHEGRPGNAGALGGGNEVRSFFQPVHDVNRRIEIAGQALSRLRPRARRAARTLRPPVVARRARKP